jgi:hypothetical protein
MTDPVSIEAGPLTRLQLECKEALEAHPYFADVKVISERQKDIENEIQVALGMLQGQGGKSGVCCLILTPRLRASKPNIPGPSFDQVAVSVLTVENPMVNTSTQGTNKAAADVALTVAGILHHFRRPGVFEALTCSEVGIGTDQRFPDFLLYTTTFNTQIGVQLTQGPGVKP